MSKRSRHSRLFSGQPGLLLVDEYPSISLPDHTDLPMRKDEEDTLVQQPIEVPEEDDDTDEDESGATARIFISSPRVPAGQPVGRSVSSALSPATPAAVAPLLGRPRQLGTPRVVAGFSHPEDLPSPAHVTPSTSIRPLDEDFEDDWGAEQEEEGRSPWDRRLEFSDEDSDEDRNHRPEPLRLALPQEAGEEASLVLAAGAVEDFDDDWDDEDDWSEEFSEDDDEDNDSIRLSLGSNSSLDFLRDLEERRSFKAPIWGPRPNSTGFDDEVSLYEESDEDVMAFDDYDDVESDDDDLVRFEDDVGSSGPASVRVGVPLGKRGPIQLRSQDNDPLSFIDSDEAAGFDTPQFPARDPLRAPRLGWNEDPTTDEEETPRAWSDLTGLGEDPVRAFVPGRPSDEAPSQVRIASSSRVASSTSSTHHEPVPARRVDSAGGRESAAPGIPPMVSAVAAMLLGMSAMALIWVQFHEPLGLPFPGAVDSLVLEPATPKVLVTPEEDITAASGTELIEETMPDAPAAESSEVVNPEAITGKLMVLSDRRAAVFLDGRKIGITPMDEPIELDAGTYTVMAVALKTGKRQVSQARVDSGKFLQVSFQFR